jgi:hypothetical protein
MVEGSFGKDGTGHHGPIPDIVDFGHGAPPFYGKINRARIFSLFGNPLQIGNAPGRHDDK